MERTRFRGFMWLAVCATVSMAVLALENSARGSTWSGGNGNWSSNGDPGWNGTGIPSVAGDTAEYNGAVTSTTTLDSNQTIGALTFGGTSNVSWTIDGASTLTIDNNGAGATIGNSNTSSGTSNQLVLSGLTVVLADNLRIENTGGSTSTGSNSGAIKFGNATSSTSVAIAGTGNVTFHNDAPIGDLSTLTNTTYVGAIGLFSSNTSGVQDSSFSGSVFVEKGLVVFNRGNHFGDTANIITIGAGQGDAALVAPALNGNYATIANDIIIANNLVSGETYAIGRFSASTNNQGTYAGNITLNGNVTLVNRSIDTNGTFFSGVMSGAGGVIKTAPGAVTLTGGNSGNTYTGDTVINEGILHAQRGSGSNAAIPNGLGKGDVYVNGTGQLGIRLSETINGLNGDGIVGTSTGATRQLALGDGDANGDFSGTLQDAVVTGSANAKLELRKIGGGVQILSGTNTYTGATLIDGGVLLVNGMHSTGDTYSVGAGGTLGGTGEISATVDLGGALAPGASAGTFTIGGLNVGDGASFLFELDPNDMTVGEGVNDLVSISGLLDVASTDASTLTLNVQDVGGGDFGGFGTWTLMTFGSLDAGDFDPSLITITGLSPGIVGTVVVDTNTVTLTTAVPEPSAMLLTSICLAGLAVARPRKRK